MPTAMKKSPSNKPLNGSTSASSSWRNSESASNTPARNAPSDIDSPIASIRSAAPITTSSAAAVNTSWPPKRATTFSTGRMTRRLTMMTAPMASTPFTASNQPLGRPVRSGLQQWQQRNQRNHREILEQQDRKRAAPAGTLSCPRSPSHASTMAVDDIASPKPVTIAAGHARSHHHAMALSTTPLTTTCAPPRPNTRWRNAQSREGSSSRPTRNSSSTTPSSAKCKGAVRVGHHAQAPRTDHRAGGEVAEHRAQLQPAEQRHDDHRGEQEDGSLREQGHVVAGSPVRPRRRCDPRAPCGCWSCAVHSGPEKLADQGIDKTRVRAGISRRPGNTAHAVADRTIPGRQYRHEFSTLHCRLGEMIVEKSDARASERQAHQQFRRVRGGTAGRGRLPSVLRLGSAPSARGRRCVATGATYRVPSTPRVRSAHRGARIGRGCECR